MWREYADNGVGVSIGFRPRALKDMPLRISQVHYIGSETAEEFLIYWASSSINLCFRVHHYSNGSGRVVRRNCC